jgi:hypothetical protein
MLIVLYCYILKYFPIIIAIISKLILSGEENGYHAFQSTNFGYFNPSYQSIYNLSRVYHFIYSYQFLFLYLEPLDTG